MADRSAPIRVLIVDDHAAARSGMAALLGTQSGIRVVAEAEGGAGGIESFRKYRPDVTILDLCLPDLDGIAVATSILMENPEALILIASIRAEKEFIDRALAAGAKAYLTKDSLRTTLISTVRAVFREERR